MQLTFATDMKVGLPGQIQDAEDSVIVSYCAASDILPGRVVEIDANNRIAYPQGTTLGRVVGVSVYVAGHPTGGWKAGDQVPVLRRGRVFAELSGGTPGNLTAANVHHSSTVATNRGRATASATNAGVGVEVSALGPCLFVRALVDSTLCILELNLP